jgi:KamA family protein
VHNQHQETYRAYGLEALKKSPYWQRLPEDCQEALSIVSMVLPFRTNKYVLDHLIDWDDLDQDPLFRMVFPQREMLKAEDYSNLKALRGRCGTEDEIRRLVARIQAGMNPHPAGQMTSNVPTLDGRPLPGLQHKYKETVLYFPSAGQTCHAYCTFCFRWPQFVGDPELKINSRDVVDLISYLRSRKEVTDLLVTGGDPMVMGVRQLSELIDALAAPGLSHVRNIRIGTKSLAYWPYKFTQGPEAKELLAAFRRATDRGQRVALMAHFTHPKELEAQPARLAMEALNAAGIMIRVQGPLLKGINDKPECWARLWKLAVECGAHPYYMFVERDTGPRNYFEVPLVRAWEIYRAAHNSVSGLARTARGPSMSAHNGKVIIDGVVTLGAHKAFALRYVQARNPDWALRPFHAKFSETATWFDNLQPLSSEDEMYFQVKSHPVMSIRPIAVV